VDRKKSCNNHFCLSGSRPTGGNKLRPESIIIHCSLHRRNIDFSVQVKGPKRDRGAFLKGLSHSFGLGLPIFRIERPLEGDAMGLNGFEHLKPETCKSPRALFTAYRLEKSPTLLAVIT